jgi:hypothetical protein
MSGLRGYDSWKTRSPDDEYADNHPEKFRRGVYTVKVTRTLTYETTVEVEASSEEDARFDAVIAAKAIPGAKWTGIGWGDDDYDTTDVEGPPSQDPDDARDERMDRELDR